MTIADYFQVGVGRNEPTKRLQEARISLWRTIKNKKTKRDLSAYEKDLNNFAYPKQNNVANANKIAEIVSKYIREGYKANMEDGMHKVNTSSNIDLGNSKTYVEIGDDALRKAGSFTKYKQTGHYVYINTIKNHIENAKAQIEELWKNSQNYEANQEKLKIIKQDLEEFEKQVKEFIKDNFGKDETTLFFEEGHYSEEVSEKIKNIISHLKGIEAALKNSMLVSNKESGLIAESVVAAHGAYGNAIASNNAEGLIDDFANSVKEVMTGNRVRDHRSDIEGIRLEAIKLIKGYEDKTFKNGKTKKVLKVGRYEFDVLLDYNPTGNGGQVKTDVYLDDDSRVSVKNWNDWTFNIANKKVKNHSLGETRLTYAVQRQNSSSIFDDFKYAIQDVNGAGDNAIWAAVELGRISLLADVALGIGQTVYSGQKDMDANILVINNRAQRHMFVYDLNSLVIDAIVSGRPILEINDYEPQIGKMHSALYNVMHDTILTHGASKEVDHKSPQYELIAYAVLSSQKFEILFNPQGKFYS